MTTKITVITACHNSAETLAHSLGSVVAQTWPNVEHILVDGASTDGTREVAKRHGQHLSRIIAEPDHGIYDAMNKGVLAATGDLIGFLNADDRYPDPDVLARVVRTMDHERLDALYGDVAFFDESNPERLIRRYQSSHFRPERVAWGWMPAHPALFVRRDVFERVGLFRTDYIIAGDFEWVARAFKSQVVRFRHLPEVLVHMRTGGVSTGGWRNTLLLNREVMRACRENDISTNWFKILSKYPAKLLEFVRS